MAMKYWRDLDERDTVQHCDYLTYFVPVLAQFHVLIDKVTTYAINGGKDEAYWHGNEARQAQSFLNKLARNHERITKKAFNYERERATVRHLILRARQNGHISADEYTRAWANVTDKDKASYTGYTDGGEYNNG